MELPIITPTAPPAHDVTKNMLLWTGKNYEAGVLRFAFGTLEQPMVKARAGLFSYDKRRQRLERLSVPKKNTERPKMTAGVKP